jgi:hypothetical protein
MAVEVVYIVFHGTTPKFATSDKHAADLYLSLHDGIFPVRVETVPLMSGRKIRELIEGTDDHSESPSDIPGHLSLCHSATGNGRLVQRVGCVCRSCKDIKEE